MPGRDSLHVRRCRSPPVEIRTKAGADYPSPGRAGQSHMAKGASSPIGRGLLALASEASLGDKGEGFRPLRIGRNPSPFRPRRLGRFAPCDAKSESPLPMGEEVPLRYGDCRAGTGRDGEGGHPSRVHPTWAAHCAELVKSRVRCEAWWAGLRDDDALWGANHLRERRRPYDAPRRSRRAAFLLSRSHRP